MGFALLSRQDDGHPLSVWSQLADIDEVVGDLCARDRAFLRDVGRLLAKHGAATRFGVTLLHSHFPVSSTEALVEAVGEDGKLITQVLPLQAAEDDPAIVPRSWMFAHECVVEGREELSVLTWSRRDHLPQQPLSACDSALIVDLAATFRDWGMTGRFGMALCGPAPGTGMIWAEGNDCDGRHLVQAPRPLEEVEGLGPVKTLYSFDRAGSGIIALGCCLSGSAGHGHGDARHPWQRRC